ncbi:MAG TPA: hypothetical protein VIV11_04005, partial [Kofleriaceae bacterium]
MHPKGTCSPCGSLARALALLLLAGCQSLLGIPDETTVLAYPVEVRVDGIVGASDQPVQIYLEDSVSGDRQTVTPTADGDYEFPRGLINGATFTVTTSAKCQPVAGAVSTIEGGPKQVTVACDGLLTLGDWGFTAPIETKLVGGQYVTYGSLSLTQQTKVLPSAHYAAINASATSNLGIDAVTVNQGIDVTVTVHAPPIFTLITERDYATRIDLSKPPEQFGYGKPPEVVEGARYGTAVDAFEEYLVVGQPERGNGRVVLYSRKGRTWKQELVLDGKTAGSKFGASVSIGKNAFVVGAPGASTAYLYKRDPTNVWQELPALTNPGRTGAAVAIEKSPFPMYFLVGAPDANVVRVYNMLGVSVGQLFGEGIEPGDEFGAAVAISDTHRAIVGAPGEDSANEVGVTDPNAAPDAGAAYYFLDVTASGTATAIKAPIANAGDRFGAAVAISRDGASYAIGAPLEDSGTTDPSDNSASGAGAVYLFTTTSMTPVYIKAPNVDVGDGFGSALAIRSSADSRPHLLVVGAPFEDGAAAGVDAASNELAGDAGAVYTVGFTTALALTPGPSFKASNPGVGDQFGAAVAITPEALLVGAPYEDSAATA